MHPSEHNSAARRHLRSAWLIMAVLLACLWAAAAQAQTARDYYVEISNQTGFVITHIYISPQDSTSWEEDVLGANRVLGKGERIRVDLKGYRSPIFDIRLVDEDGDTYTYWKVDVSRRDIVARIEHLDRK
ncbi:MAG: hypothetical protein AB1735_07995 [Pseudomonadota bacterium]